MSLRRLGRLTNQSCGSYGDSTAFCFGVFGLDTPETAFALPFSGSHLRKVRERDNPYRCSDIVLTIGPGPGIEAIAECVMSPSTSQLLTSVYEAVKDLEEMYGPTDQGVVQAKQVLVACLASVRLIETPEEAELFTSAHQLVDG